MTEKQIAQTVLATEEPAKEQDAYLFPTFDSSSVGNTDYPMNKSLFTGTNVDRFGMNESARIFDDPNENPWSAEERLHKGEPLSSSFMGRFGIRTISRGIVGVSAMTWGGLVMRDYDPHFMRKARELAELGSPEALENARFIHKSVDYIVRGIDATIKPFIQEVIARPWGKIKGLEGEKLDAFVGNSTRFRTKVNYSEQMLAASKDVMQEYNDKYGEYKPDTYREWLSELAKDSPEKLAKLNVKTLNGRDLGHEMVSVTFDFASMSAADALARNIITAADPNVNLSWVDKDGHVDLKKLTSSAFDTAKTIVLYNQGEDWAVALPYVYTMRALRNSPSLARENMKHTIDNDVGAALVVDAKNGDIKGNTLGASALNFQIRFMAYNFYTSMYRDFYHSVGHALDDKKEVGDTLNPSKWEVPTLEDAASAVRHSIDYMAVSLIKSAAWMAPAVPFFWAPRMAMSRMNGRAIYDNGGLDGQGMGVVTSTPATPVMPMDGHFYATPSMVVTKGAPARYLTDKGLVDYAGEGKEWFAVPYREQLVNPKTAYTEMKQAYAGDKLLSGSELMTNFDPLHSRKGDSYLSFLLNPVARLGRSATTFVNEHVTSQFAKPAGQSYYFRDPRDVAQRFAGNCGAYLFYVTAKSEGESHINNAATDASLHLAVDGMWELNGDKITTGMADFFKVIIKHPISEQTYERMYQGTGFNAKQHENDLAYNARHGVTLPTHAQTVARHKEIGYKPTVNLYNAPNPVKTPVTGEKNIAADAVMIPENTVTQPQHLEQDLASVKHIADAAIDKAKKAPTEQMVLHSKRIADELIQRTKSAVVNDMAFPVEGNKLHAERVGSSSKGAQSWKEAQLRRAAQDMAQSDLSGATIH